MWMIEKRSTSRQYYTAGGSINWFVLCMTYIAALMSTWVFFAGPGGYYRGGMGYWFSELSYMPIFPVLTYFVMNKVWLLNSKRHYTTPADIYDDRFRCPLLRLCLAILFFCVSIPYAASVYMACGEAAQVASGNVVSSESIIMLVCLVAIVFVWLGGVRTVAWASTFEGWIFIIALWLIAVSALHYGFHGSFGGAVSYAWKHQISWFSYPGPADWVPYSARFGYPLACAIGWTIMLPDVFVRAGYFGKNLEAQRRLMFFEPILQFIVWTGVAVLGMLAIVMLPGLKGGDTELVIPLLIKNIIATRAFSYAAVLMVVFVLGALSKGLTAANSHLLVAGSIISEDILTKLLKVKVKPVVHVTISRICVSVLGLLAMWVSLHPPQLIWTLIMFAIAIVMPAFPVLVAALYWRRATAPAAVIATVAGVATVLLTYQYGYGNNWYGAFGLAVSAVLMIVISLVTPKTDEKVLDEFYGALDEAEIEHYAAIES
jgi:Na+/proline symporter